jgi:hypothetical protein
MGAPHLASLPKLRLGDLTAHDQLTVKCCEFRRLDQDFFPDAKIIDRVVHGCSSGARDGLGTRSGRARRDGGRGTVGRTVRGRCSCGETGLRGLQDACLTHGTVAADDGRELCLERLAFCESHRGCECEVVAITIILEANLEAYLSCAFFGGEECCKC